MYRPTLSAQPFGHNYIQRFFYPLVARTWRETPDALPSILSGLRIGA